jgi:predicted O-methyltransferase YrrM
MSDATRLATVEDVVAASGSIPGWTDPDDAAEIVRAALRLPAGATIVEIGAYMGRCTVLLAGGRRLAGSGTVHSVDPFDCSGDEFSVPYYVEGLRETGLPSLEDAFRQNVARLDLDAWVEVHRGRDIDVAARWSGPIDLLLLDGDQSPHGARAAYEAWAPFLVPGGTIVVRNTLDRNYAPGHDGHRRLALEELRAPRFGEVRIGETAFAIRQG